MKKNCWGLLASVVMGLCLVLVGLGGSASAGPAPLPVWEAPRMVGHLEDVGETLRRLADSFFMGSMTEGVPNRDAVLGWLQELPLESVTWVRGLLEETEAFFQGDERYFQGVVRFGDDPAVRELLQKLAGGAEADEAMAYALLKVPDDEAVREVVELSLSNAGEGIYDVEIETHGWLYDLVGDWSFQASVVRDGDGFVLLFGGSGEDLARARAALGDDKERLKIARRSEHGNFVQLIDDPDGTLAKEIFDGLGFEPQWPGFLELSLGVEAGRIALALRHNLYEAAFGGAAKPGTAASLKDPGLKFGGGVPWLIGIGSVLLEREPLLGLLAFLSGEEAEEIVEALSSLGVSVETLMGAFRTFGLVLGGDAALFGKPVPGLGGYVFASGEAEKMKALVSLIKGWVSETLDALAETEREGWDAFYTLNPELQVDGAFPFPFFIGVKDGVLMAGVLGEGTLETAPKLGLPDDGVNRVLCVGADFSALTSGLTAFLASPALEDLPRLAEQLDFDLQSLLSFGSRLLSSLQGVGGVRFSMEDWGTMDLEVTVREVDDKALDALRKGFSKAEALE